MAKKQEDLLKEIRDNFTYAVECWKDIREEGQKDMRYLAGDPWDPKERRAREDANRPCLSPDELNQYVNQLNNEVRQNPIGVKVVPKGSGATEKSAEINEGIIRQIEYKSNAKAAYQTAFENAAQKSYGYWKVMTRYVSDSSWEQEIVIRPIPNADTVYLDPDTKEPDSSDMAYGFHLDVLPKSRYRERFPKSDVIGFNAAQIAEFPQWVRDEQIQVAEYWKVEREEQTVILLNDKGQTAVLEDYKSAKLIKEDSKQILFFGDGMKVPVLDSRKSEQRSVIQYITNGVEILEENEWAGKWIPIIPVWGKEIFVDDGSGAKRKLMSLIRLARDPYMMYCFLCTGQAEEAGMTPKTPFIGAEGQFAGHEAEWQSVNKVPIAFLQYKVITEGSSGPIPPPQRQPFQPNFQAYEIAKESYRRAIQSAIGMYNASVGKHDSSGQSGKAIEALDSQSNQGSFHFIDNFKRSVEHGGRVMLDLIPKIYDTAREVGIRKANESYESVKINQPYTEKGQRFHHKMDEGEHDVTVTTGPSFESQREEATNFMQTLAGTPQGALILDLLIKAKQLGPLGDEMAQRLTPPQFAKPGSPEQMQQTLQQMQQQLQAMNAYAKQAESEIHKLQAEKQGKMVDNEYRMQLEKLKIEAQVTIAEIGTKAQEVQTRMKYEQDIWLQMHSQAHEAGLQANEQVGEMALAQQAQEAAANQSQEQPAS